MKSMVIRSVRERSSEHKVEFLSSAGASCWTESRMIFPNKITTKLIFPMIGKSIEVYTRG